MRARSHYSAPMIHLYSPVNEQRWNRGEHQVQLLRPGQTRPLGYCDGTEDDERELRDIAEAEGVEDLPISKRVLKTGRQIWTLGHPPKPWVDDTD